LRIVSSLVTEVVSGSAKADDAVRIISAAAETYLPERLIMATLPASLAASPRSRLDVKSKSCVSFGVQF
jgi:hypothetical protein